MTNSEMTEPDRAARRSELKGFLFLTVVLVPALAGTVIATYGLFVWIYQVLTGPPTG